MTTIKFAILAAFSLGLSGFLNVYFGGWNRPLTVLCILMAVDYISGVALALFWQKSPKTDSGGASSAVGARGLVRKLFFLLLVGVAYQIDNLTGLNYVRDAVALFFAANEALSVIENAGLMGIPIPRILRRGIDVLKGKAEELPEGKASRKDDHPPDGTEQSREKEGVGNE